MSPYAELHCLTPFSFLRGASTARELFVRAKAQGYAALAITDECSLAGIVRAHEASKETGISLIVGTEIRLPDGLHLVLLAESLAGYQTLCALITHGRRNADKGEYRLTRADCENLVGVLALWVPGKTPRREDGAWVARNFPEHAWLAVELHRGSDDESRLRELLALANELGLPAVAAGDVHMHARSRRRLQDTMTAIRHRTTVAQAGAHLFPNGERHLRSRRALAAIYPAELLAETIRITERCRFSLTELSYVYPHELVPDGQTRSAWLRALTEQGMRRRWPDGTPAKVSHQIEKELALIAELNYESYFLTVEDIVRFARSRGILCQGRGSAANSAVCFALGITEVDPARMNTLFERFISRERNEPPDIDIDFEHERREEVIQYIYAKYGRERAALAATVICYRMKSAVRDAAKALGQGIDQVDQLSRALAGWSRNESPDERLKERGFDPDSPVIRRVLSLAHELLDMPRHLSQHVGGFVISEQPLSHLVPVENAAMPDRTIIQWDKDDLDTLGLLKIDCLALGMLTCLRKCLDLLKQHGRGEYSLATIPAEDAQTYAMLQQADTVGVFQIESRAQMSMLPRLKPACFYDLVIQIAIVRPGPIQGDMVHPYLRRRQGLEPYEPMTGKLRGVMDRTLGIPLFQEQVMELAIHGADFTPGEADQLRRGMAAWKRRGGLEPFHERLLAGFLKNGYTREFAERVFEQIKGFASYGFPESHSASFALLAYASAWLKCHEPAAFAAALLNAQPLGFYAPSQIVQDLQRHGTKIRPIDVRYSDWDATLEKAQTQPILRLGMREIRGLSEDAGKRVERARMQQSFRDAEDLCERAGLDARERKLLADAGALKGLAGHRHRARWTVAGVERTLPLFEGNPTAESDIALRPPTAADDVWSDYANTGQSLGPHPVSFVRSRLRAKRCKSAIEAGRLEHGSPMRYAGLVLLRQQPATASGVTFVTLEDETGTLNAIVWRDVARRHWRVFRESRLLAIDGVIERHDGVQHLVARSMQDYSPLLERLDARSRDFR
ncbi:MAG: error-prone DNA polymerase [Xanthomonadaceae bacterium]|nr:error-prone DNA polymerase [Xanthomonadaceae bacterium]